MDEKTLETLGWQQRERLYFIEFNVLFLGSVGRQEMEEKFDCSPAVFTRDMAAYREYAPKNCAINHKLKRYEATSDIKPIFEHDIGRVLLALSQGYGEGLSSAAKGYLPAEFPLQLNQPTVQVLSMVSRAIHQRKALNVNYQSYSTGGSKRELVPHGLMDSGNRWHVRAFDRKSQQFRDFAINRISRPTLLDEMVPPNEKQEHDHQWLRMVTLELVPHPKAAKPDVIEADYAMCQGVLKLNVRASSLGYILQHWSIDCSPDSSLDPIRYRLRLLDSDKVLYGVGSAVMAPGYRA